MGACGEWEDNRGREREDCESREEERGKGGEKREGVEREEARE